MSLLYDRQCRLTVGERAIGPSILTTTSWHYKDGAGLRIAFDITKTLEANPNPGKIQIYNLSPTSRNALAKGMQVTLEAGYAAGMSVVFAGQIRFVQSMRQGVDWVTTLMVTDGADVLMTPLALGLSPGTDVRMGLLDVVSQLEAAGVDTGEARARITAQAPKVSANGISLVGTVKDLASELAAVFQKGVSVQDNKLQVLDAAPGNPATFTTSTLVLLNDEAGLISPIEFLEDPSGEKDGWVKLTSKLNGDIAPGAAVAVGTFNLAGRFRAEACKYVGDTHGQPWDVTFEARPL